MPTLTSLPPHVQYSIFRYALLLNPNIRFTTENTILEKLRFYSHVQPYEALTPLWAEFIQKHLWREILVRYDEIAVLRTMLDKNPRLCFYIEKLTVIDASIAFIVQHQSMREHPERFTPQPTNPKNTTFSDIWTSLTSLITDKLAGNGGIFRSLVIRAEHPRATDGALLGDSLQGSPRPDIICPIFINLSAPPECSNSLQLTAVKDFNLIIRSAPLPPVRVIWNPESLGVMVAAMAGGLKTLVVDVSDEHVMERTERRGLYVALSTFCRGLTPTLYPNLTTFRLVYNTYQPVNHSDTGTYPYTALDSGKDFLSRALRILSKQLVHFTLEYCRISTTLFVPDSDEPEEPLYWPYLKTYSILMTMVDSLGEWLWEFHPRSNPPPVESTLIPRTMHNATDNWMPPRNDTFRSNPIRAGLDPFFKISSQAMAPLAHTPSLEHWSLEAERNTIYLKYFAKSELEDMNGQAEIRWNGAYVHVDGVMKAWVDRCEEKGGGFIIMKIPPSDVYGLEFLDEEDRVRVQARGMW